MDNNGDFEVVEKESSISSEAPKTSLLVSLPPPSVLPSFMVPCTQTSSVPSMCKSTKNQNVAPVVTETQIPRVSSDNEDQTSKTLIESSMVISDGQKVESAHVEKNWMGWLRGTVNSVGNKVVETARSSMDSMITTLDPQMKNFINTGGDIEILVASDKNAKVSPIKDAFQKVFGKATVSGVSAELDGSVVQPVGFDSVMSVAGRRIDLLRSRTEFHPQQPVLTVESFVVSLQPESWVEMSLLLLDDPYHDVILHSYTQPIPIPDSLIADLKSVTSDDYLKDSGGFSETVSNIAVKKLQISHGDWKETFVGISERDLLLSAAKVLAALYRNKLPSDVL